MSPGADQPTTTGPTTPGPTTEQPTTGGADVEHRVVATVLGERATDTLGRTDYHEHLFQVSPLLPGDELDDEAASTAEARSLLGSGFAAMVDATPTGLGRRPAALARASADAGLAVVATTGAHREAHYGSGHWLTELDEAALARRFVADVREGIPGIDEAERGDRPPV